MPLRIPDDLSKPYTRYGVTIGRLTLAEVETLRARRNDPSIAQYMIFRDHISAEEQLAWFNNVDNRSNLFATIYWEGQFIGMINLRDIDAENCCAEGGIMVWAVEHQNSLVPFRAALVGTDLAFWEYGFERMTARILQSNTRAIRFNRALGYRFDPPNADGIVFGVLTNPGYWRATLPLREVIDRVDGTVNGGVPLPPYIPPLPPEEDDER